MDQRVQPLVDRFLAQLDGVLPGGYQAVLYGSATRGDWQAAISDINILIIATPLGPAELRGLGPALRALPEEWRTPPLILSAEEWSRAGDVFPIELTDLIYSREVLRGADPMIGVQPHPTQLRAALERELRIKVVRLRQGYAMGAEDPAALGDLACRTLATILALARATLMLLGRPVPGDAVQVLRAFAEVTGARAAPLVEVAGHWREEGWSCSAPLFEAYLDSLSAAVEFVDHHVPGAR
jgi:predicted nucleotidyltransferase